MIDQTPVNPSSPATPAAVPKTRRPPTFTIAISGRTIALIFTIVALVWVFNALPETLLILSLAILLATIVDRPASVLAARGIPRGIGISAVLIGLVGSLAAVIALLEPIIVGEYSAIQESLGTYQSQAEHSLKVRGISLSGFSTHRLSSWVSSNLTGIADSAASLSLSIGHIAVAAFATVVLAYMLAASPETLSGFIGRFFSPRPLGRLMRILGDVHGRITGWAKGQLLVAASFGLLFGIALWIARIPYAASLGIIAGVLEVIPYLGGVLTLIVAAVIALTVSIQHVIAVVVIYVILINIESHILAPKLIGSAVGLPPAAVLVALLMGLELKGIVGVLLAVPVALVVASCIDEFWPATAVNSTTGTPVSGNPATDPDTQAPTRELPARQG